MYIILNKKRTNMDELLNEIYEKKVKNNTEENNFLNIGGEECFESKIREKEYYTKKLGFSAALTMAQAEKDKIKKKYKHCFNKKVTVDIMAAEKNNIVGILVRNKGKLIAVLENWEINEKE